MMNYGQLKEIMAQLAAMNLADNVEVKVQMVNGDRTGLKAMPFSVEGQDAGYSIDAAGHWAASISQPAAILFHQD